MAAELDHVFICTLAGAPAAERLRAAGLVEGSPNTHPGQGTACRRFFFENSMLELLWVADELDAQSEQTRRTMLWERWSAAGRIASPFGIILRPKSGESSVCPFPAWEYRPPTMPGLVLRIAEGTGVDEPMWCYAEGGRPPAEAPVERRQPLEHPLGLRELSGLRLVCPPVKDDSVTRAMADRGLIELQAGEEHLIDLEFDGSRKGKAADLRLDLPLLLRW